MTRSGDREASERRRKRLRDRSVRRLFAVTFLILAFKTKIKWDRILTAPLIPDDISKVEKKIDLHICFETKLPSAPMQKKNLRLCRLFHFFFNKLEVIENSDEKHKLHAVVDTRYF